MKKSLLIVLTSLFVTLGFGQVDSTGITVTGTGTTYGEPDMAIVDLGVDTVDADITVASTKTDEVVTALMAAFEKLGIDRKDVRTTYFNIYRETPYSSDGTPTDPVYHVQNLISITVRDINQVGQLVTNSIAAGANVVNSVQYTLSNPNGLAKEARELAMKDALAKSQELATLSRVELGDIVMITDSSYAIPTPMPAYDARVSATPIAAGQLAVNVTLSVRFEITQRGQ
jgi:uncharacterized protein